MMTDPIADMLARIRNAALARHPELACPALRILVSMSPIGSVTIVAPTAGRACRGA